MMIEYATLSFCSPYEGFTGWQSAHFLIKKIVFRYEVIVGQMLKRTLLDSSDHEQSSVTALGAIGPLDIK